MTIRWDLLGLGAVTVDDLVYVDHYPAPDTKMPIQAQQRQGGGLAGTALVAASRLGAQAAYYGVLGDDELSRFTLEEFEREGVDCSPCHFQPDARPVHAIVIVDRSTAQRSILYSYDGVVKPQPQDITDDLIARCRVLCVDHSVAEAALRAVELAHARGIPIVADVENEAIPFALELAAQIDHLIVSIGFAERVTGEHEPSALAHALARSDRAACVVTAGERGCWYAEHNGEAQHVPALRVKVVDTTGCGDVFHGAYAACLARGADVPYAVQFATVAAGLKATQPGGRSGIPDRATVEHVLQKL